MEKITIKIKIVILSLVDTSFVKHEIAVNYYYIFKASILSQCDFFLYQYTGYRTNLIQYYQNPE